MVLNLTPPGARLPALALDELLDAVQIALHAAIHEAERAADRFERDLRLILQLESDPR